MTARFDGGDPHGMVYHPNDIEEHSSAVLLAKDIADYLEKAYGGWLWAIEVNSKGGVVNIRSLRLSGEWGYVLKIEWVQHDPIDRRRRVLRAAGEILERFGVKAAPYSRAQFERIPRDLAGKPKPDLSDKHGKVQRRARDDALTAAVKSGAVKLRWGDITRSDGSRYRRILLSGAKPKDPDVRAG